MKRIIKTIFLVTLLFGCIGVLTSCKKSKPVETTFPELVNELTSYKLTGKLESHFPSGTKESLITTYYKAPNSYRVEIQNPNVNETQVMIKNNSGVYVLIPSINKTFKVNSNWPSNNSYPYLLQSLSNDMISDNNKTTTTTDTNTTVKLKAKLFNNNEDLTQQIIFGEDKLPSAVTIYDSNNNVLMNFKVSKIETNINIDDSYFMSSQTLETLNAYYTENPIEYERSITYPTYYPMGTSLETETLIGSTNNCMSIMKFSGEANYTIIQKYVEDFTSSKVEYVNGEISVIGGVFNFISDNYIQFYENGIEYSIASNEVSILEMLKMADSLRLTDIK